MFLSLFVRMEGGGGRCIKIEGSDAVKVMVKVNGVDKSKSYSMWLA